MAGALDKQVGGDHYKKGFAIQPVEFIWKNKMEFIEGNIVKYVCRHRVKGGKTDLLKAMDYLQKLIEMEYPDQVVVNPPLTTPPAPVVSSK